MKKNILLIIALYVLATFAASSFSFSTTIAPSSHIRPNDEHLGIEVPVLMYHHISNDVTSEAVVTPGKFQSDMYMLKKNGYTGIFLTELVDYLNGHIELPERPII
ncbi:MAG: hypothetical protein K8R73_06570, partial [Clostridiales bacterium]|nr:hypothetical protein [Clostridiales bacterium]